MRPFAAIAAVLLIVVIASAQQTDDQKVLMDKHKRVLKESIGDKKSSAEKNFARLLAYKYLLARRQGVPFIEDFIIDARKSGRIDLWEESLGHYMVPHEDIPDKLLPEYAFRLKKQIGLNIGNADFYVEFGERGKLFIPILEEARDKVNDDITFKHLNSAIRQLKQVAK